jgi:hypothetical protein
LMGGCKMMRMMMGMGKVEEVMVILIDEIL